MRLILVLGMHRSGTSLLARSLAALGAATGTDLLAEPVPDNPHGYFEHAGVLRLHQRLLRALGRDPALPEAVLPLPAGWQEHPATRRAARDLATLLAEERRALPPGAEALVIKDPRTALLLPLWQEVAARLGIPWRAVLALRAPGAVAASLLARDDIPPARAEALWLRHLAEALRHAGDHLALIQPYEALLAAPAAAAAQLAATLALPVQELPDGLVDGALNHHAAAPAPVLPLAGALHARLLAAPGPQAARAAAAPLLQAFEAGVALLGASPGLLGHALDFGVPAGHARPVRLRVPAALQDPTALDTTVALAAGPTAVAIRHGNRYWHRRPNGFVLAPNPIGAPPMGLEFQGLALPPGRWRLASRLWLAAEAEPMRLEVQLLQGGLAVAEAQRVLSPGEMAEWEAALPVPTGDACCLRLQVVPDAAARHEHGAFLGLVEPVLLMGT